VGRAGLPRVPGNAKALLAQERRRIAKYNQKTADALRVVELEARP